MQGPETLLKRSDGDLHQLLSNDAYEVRGCAFGNVAIGLGGSVCFHSKLAIVIINDEFLSKFIVRSVDML